MVTSCLEVRGLYNKQEYSPPIQNRLCLHTSLATLYTTLYKIPQEV
jgi:hypothetical protein